MAEFVKPDGEIGALWERESERGKYMTGVVNGVKVVVFSAKKTSEKSPDWRVLESKPRESREQPSRRYEGHTREEW